MTNPNSAAQAAEQDPINAAILLLTEEADSISDCHTRTPGDWAGEPEAKAHYDHVRSVVDALSKLRAPVADERAAFKLLDAWQAVCDRIVDQYGGVVAGVDFAALGRANRAALASALVADERQAVAYLDLGAGGYMDVGTDLTDEQLAALPKGRHMLAIIGTHGVDGYTPASAPVAGEAVYTLRVRGAIQAWTPTAAAFSIPDGEHQLFLSPAAPQPSAEPARILFPSHLRKVWSGGEVQAWLDQHQGVTPPPATTTGSLARYRQWKAEQDQAAAPCTCPSGDGSLRHPCPAHPKGNPPAPSQPTDKEQA